MSILPGIGSLMVKSSPFPILRGSAQSSTQNSGTSFSPTLPAHQAGDVLVVVVGYVCDPTPRNISATGWTELAERHDSTDTNGIAVYYLLATGSSHTITITNGNNAKINAHAYVLQYADGIVEASSLSGFDPPSLSPSWGSDSTFWMVGLVCGGTGSQPSAGPSGFSNGIQDTGPTLSTLDKTDNSATLDPGIYTAPGSNPVCVTIAVKPQ